MFDAGLSPTEPDTVAPALAQLEADGTDSDQDGIPDVQELAEGSNPNVKGDSTLCGPRYGCGARVAPTDRVDLSALLAALLAGGALIFSRRRRRRAVTSRGKSSSAR